MIFHFKVAQHTVAEHYERDFDMIFYFRTVQNLVAEHCERDFDMISYIKMARNLVAERYERYFDMIFHYKTAQNLFVEHYERYFDIILHLKRLNTWLQNTMEDILTWFSTLWWHKIWLPSIITEDRLTGLALMAMNKNRFHFDDTVQDNFNRKKAKRL